MLLASILLLIVDSMLVIVVPTLPFNSAIAFVFLSIAALLLPMNVRFSIAIVPATLMSFSFWSTRLVRPPKSPLMPSTLTFTLLIVLLIVLLFSAILTSTDLSTLLIIVVLFSLIAFAMFWLITVLLASILVSIFLLITTLFSVILLLIVVSIF